MTYINEFYPESKFGEFTNIDGTIVFYNRVNALLDPSYTIVDLGCGRGEYQDDTSSYRKNLRVMKGKVAHVIGIDVDKNGVDNPFIDEFRLLDGPKWPAENNSVDLIICDWVVEHIQNPDLFFSEAVRVLKKGGYVCIRTTNKFSYLGLAATLVPNKFHSKVTSYVQKERKSKDVFPTTYKCNSIRKMRRYMSKYQFSHSVFGFQSEPCYCSFSWIAYGLGVLHQKFIPTWMSPAIFAFGKLDKSNDSPTI